MHGSLPTFVMFLLVLNLISVDIQYIYRNLDIEPIWNNFMQQFSHINSSKRIIHYSLFITSKLRSRYRYHGLIYSLSF